MGKQLLFCVETSQKAATDTVYIEETIEHFFRIGNDVRKRYIYLSGKSNYNKASIHKKIETQKKQYSAIGPTVVIYFLDTDKYDSDPRQMQELKEIHKYCQENNYELVWFCRDIEDVFWDEQIPNDNKTAKAAQFRSSKRINNLNEARLKKTEYGRHYSNVLKVLEKHLEPKKC